MMETLDKVNARRRFWIGVASADHARKGSAEGFMQVCHGKAGPLRSLKVGDGIAYYSPATSMGGKDRLQSFTTIGTIRDERVYQVEMTPDFKPYRRDVDYFSAHASSILPLLASLEFTRGRKNWGYGFRFGILEINQNDFRIIAKSMGVVIDNCGTLPV